MGIVSTVAPVAITGLVALVGYEYALSGQAGPLAQIVAKQIQAAIFPPQSDQEKACKAAGGTWKDNGCVITSSTTAHNCPMIGGERYVTKLQANLFQLVWRGRIINLYPTQALAEAAYNVLCQSDYYKV